ncbi:MAG: hypothetical protein AAF548_15115 [Actinomycetota bacterium]
MYLLVEFPAGAVTLEEADVFTAFHVAAPPNADDATVAGLVGGRADGGHVWVPVDVVRSLAGGAATDAWDESFAGMVDYAAGKGWVSADRSAIRAHIERVGISARPGLS